MVIVLLLCCVTCMTGLRLTVYSLEDVVKFLLNHGFEYVLTSKFSQDPLEEHLAGTDNLLEDLQIRRCRHLEFKKINLEYNGPWQQV